MRRWENLVNKYLGILETRGVSDSYMLSMRSEMDRWGSWLKRCKPRPGLEAVNTDMVVDYLRSRTKFKSKVTTYGVISRMRCMGNHLVNEGVWQRNPLRWIRGPKLTPCNRVPKRIGRVQMDELMHTAAGSRTDYGSYMWVTILTMLYATGMRRGELERLNVRDWNREEMMVKVDGRKTGAQRSVPVAPIVAQCIEAYLPRRQNQLEKLSRYEEESLFIDRRGHRLKGDYISKGVHRIANRAGIPLVTIHQFRHTCASDLLESGTRVTYVQRFLGHAVLETTARYLHIADPERKRAIEKHPINRMLGVVESQPARRNYA